MRRNGQWDALQHPLNVASAAARAWLNQTDFNKNTSLNFLIYITFLALHGCQNTFLHTLTTPDGSIKIHIGDNRMNQRYRAHGRLRNLMGCRTYRFSLKLDGHLNRRIDHPILDPYTAGQGGCQRSKTPCADEPRYPTRQSSSLGSRACVPCRRYSR